MARTPVTQSHILSLLELHHDLSAPDVVRILAESNHEVNKATVYRALDKLLEQGIICRQLLHDEVPTYELRDHHHDHVVCEECGNVFSIPCVSPHPHIPDGFVVSHHHVTIYGICKKCKQSTS